MKVAARRRRLLGKGLPWCHSLLIHFSSSKMVRRQLSQPISTHPRPLTLPWDEISGMTSCCCSDLCYWRFCRSQFDDGC
ncbi:hypothetical protein DAI22_05g139900 [Oryza sativa Japonica Group]|nr:hypothetical protein DAI22_05g139900 [Oryza sativa Japonica Group]